MFVMRESSKDIHGTTQIEIRIREVTTLMASLVLEKSALLMPSVFVSNKHEAMSSKSVVSSNA